MPQLSQRKRTLTAVFLPFPDLPVKEGRPRTTQPPLRPHDGGLRRDGTVERGLGTSRRPDYTPRAMETTIVGLPLAGKTTLFNGLTGLEATTSGYAGGHRSLNLADVPVPDERVAALSEMFRPRKTTFASVTLKDPPMETSDDGSLTASAIAEMRSSDAVALVVRAFIDEGVPHPRRSVDPHRDLRELLDILVFSDFAVASGRLERLVKEGRKGEREHAVLAALLETLEGGRPIGVGALGEAERRLLSGFAFITAKPLIVVANTGERTVDLAQLRSTAEELGFPLFELSGLAEMEIAALSPEDQEDFLGDLGVGEPARDRFLKTVYAELSLISFLTAGEDEVRAWSIPRGLPAVRAAGRIHSDLEKGFIRAEVIRWDDLHSTGGFKEAKAAGRMRLEGKEYVVQDGDVLTIRFNL